MIMSKELEQLRAALGNRKIFGRTFSTENFCLRVEKSNVGNHLKRVFPNSQAERSHPRGVNVRSKFALFSVSVFRRFCSLQASYRAETLTADGSRPPGQSKKFCMQTALTKTRKIEKNFRNSLKNSRTRGWWNARSAKNFDFACECKWTCARS